MENKKLKFISVRKKLLCTILFVSTMVSTCMTFLQYYREYSHKLQNLDKAVHNLKDSSLSSVTRSLWNLDDQQLVLQIDSMLKVPDIVAVRILDEEGNLYYEAKSSGRDQKDRFAITSSLLVKNHGVNRKIGDIEIYATEQYIKQEILENFIFFLMTQFIKTLLISMMILLVVRHYLTKHIEQISRFMLAFDFSSSEVNKVRLDRDNSYRDEVDQLVESLNTFVEKLSEANKQKNQRILEQEKEIQIQKAASINQARLASLGEMAASIAHEINNPLTVLAFSGKKLEQLADSDHIDSGKLLHFISMINKTIQRMCKTIDGLKKLGRNAEGDQMKDVKIHELVLNVLDLCQVSLASKGIEVKTKYNDIDPEKMVNCREVQITQILVNLLNNSVDVVKGMEKPWVEIDTRIIDENIYFSIIDCGPGIPEEIENKIFQPFFTTKEVGEGTGLGLSISAQMAREHKGRLFVDRSISHTKMTLELPINL